MLRMSLRLGGAGPPGGGDGAGDEIYPGRAARGREGLNRYLIIFCLVCRSMRTSYKLAFLASSAGVMALPRRPSIIFREGT